MESRGPEDSKNVKTSQAYFFEGFISFFEDFSLTMATFIVRKNTCNCFTESVMVNSVSVKQANPHIALPISID